MIFGWTEQKIRWDLKSMKETNTFPLCRWCIGTGGPPILPKIISSERRRFGVRESIFGRACAWPVHPCTGKRVQNGEMGFPCAQREGGEI